ncbi:hypothetical protein F5J12DRAFT_823158 [Pisolithus orientalis]|uniref:uncharacterized protein n=1 Tax=Pisolithus orientalis TaxID=936130 RepID=UPI0022242702|nr:uncharacterized protein F5J12DRAFT_823158 [Pisolithus orientalis]KAI6010970.1 hypothetical protein F5J12DRAFT_823158 [Pisolithus orientalis]
MFNFLSFLFVSCVHASRSSRSAVGVEPSSKIGLTEKSEEATSGTVDRAPAPIDILPVGVLAQILLHAILADAHRCDVHRHRKQELASVSRCWRDTIFDNPTFWTTINLTPQWMPSLVEAHVQRSGCLFVDVEIGLWKTPEELDTLSMLLSIAMRCVERWRSLIFYGNSIQMESYLRQMKDVIFPSLAYLIVDDQFNHPYSFGFKPKNMPALDYLKIDRVTAVGALSFPPNLRILEMNNYQAHGFPSLRLTLPSEKLTTLVLRGDGWTVDPVTIHFPHLASLTLTIPEAKQLLNDIVAPQLRHLRYNHHPAAENPVSVFAQLKSKFITVTDLDIWLGATIRNTELAIVGHAIADAFPKVCHLALATTNLPVFFGQYGSEERSPAGKWSRLECLTLLWGSLESDTGELVSWLQRRTPKGQTMLRVQLSQEISAHTFATYAHHSRPYQLLRECCVLEQGVNVTDSFGPNIELPQFVHQYNRIASALRSSSESCGKCWISPGLW